MKKIWIILIAANLLASCTKEEFESPYLGDGTQIDIYLIKEGQIDYSYSQNDIDLETLKLEKEPWLKHSDIKFYDWSSHIFYLKKERKKSLARQFVLTANKKPILLGSPYSLIMSSIPQFPSIMTDDIFYPKNVISFGGTRFFSNTAQLNKIDKFREAMENSGLLKEGINVDLIEIQKRNSTSIKYTYKVTNLDTEKIYILDPDKMGASRFHYYTNGVSFMKDESYYYAEDKSVTSVKNFNSSWYYKLAPGHTMRRTVTLNGFRSLPSGNVDCYFFFPAVNLKDGTWEKRDGRIWLGGFSVKKELNLQ